MILGKSIVIVVPGLIYEIYNNTAKTVGNISTAEVMAVALEEYARYLVADMQRTGELPQDSPQLTIV